MNIISKLFVALHTSVNLWALERMNERKKECLNWDSFSKKKEGDREMSSKDIKWKGQ